MNPQQIEWYRPSMYSELPEKEKAVVNKEYEGIIVTWEDGSLTFHLMYEPSTSFVFEDLAVILGHEQIIFLRDKKEVFRTFTR